jgi:hypothetical protein
MYAKRPRIVDQELLATVRTLPCLACLPRIERPVHAHHVTTVKSGGDDSWNNVMPLCASHHSMWHTSGPNFMIREFAAVKTWLEGAGRHDVLERAARSSPSHILSGSARSGRGRP